MVCYGQYGGRTTLQEYYDTASRDAGKRARELRKAGFKVWVTAMGDQITRVGRVKLTSVNVQFPDGRAIYSDDLPPVQVEWI